MRTYPRISWLVALGCLTTAALLGQPAQPASNAVSPKGAKSGKSGKLGSVPGSARVVPWWALVDTGPFISDTFRFSLEGEFAALKGVAIKVGPQRESTLIFDTELLAWRAGLNGAVRLEGTAWSGSHGGSSFITETEDSIFFMNTGGRLGIGLDGSWADTRDPKSGPLPHTVGRYKGLYRHGQQVVLHYTVGGVKVFERPSLEAVGDTRALVRTLNVDATSQQELSFLVLEPAPAVADPRLKKEAQAYLAGAPAGVELVRAADGRTTVRIAKGTAATRFKIVYAERALETTKLAAAEDLAPLTKGGPGLFAQTFTVKGELDPAAAKKTYAVDVVPLPADNPWKSQTRFGGFDFLPGGKAIAASTWNGDVWIADGIDGDLAQVTWRRFASGMYQTLGLKVVDGKVYTQGRDQITRLHDFNGDGEADFYECFNNDVRITDGFHEFSFDLETDREGNFYFSKAMPVNQGGRGFAPWTPHNGTVMKVSKDGSKLDVVAWGLRAPGGVGVSPDGVVTTGENEGSFVPQCKITWTPPGKLTFNGVVPGTWENRGDWKGPLPGAPTDYDRPLLWLPYHADNSSGSQAWVPQNTKWDPRHAGEMLHLSYGKSSIFRVMREEVNGVMQGGAYRLNIDIAASAMRARFHPDNGQLYVIGFRGWQTNGRDAFQRVRYTGVTVPQPVGLNAHKNGVLIRFSAPLDPKTAEDPARYSISKWNYVWGPQYGSGRFSIDQRDTAAEEKALSVPSKGAHNIIDSVAVGAAKLLDDGRSVFLYIPKMTAAMQMEMKLDLADPKGAPVRETIYSTVHEMAPEYKIAGIRWDDIKVAPSAPVGEPGLAMSFDSEVTDTVKVDQLALTVPQGSAPSVLVGSGRGGFGVAWQGTLVVPERDDYTFTLEGNGTATLQIDGKPVAAGPLPLVAKLPLTLAKGAHPLYASFRSSGEGEARVRLLWSSSQFRDEPVPATAFRHMPGAEQEAWAKVRAGREVFFAAQCVKCHAPGSRNIGRDSATPELFAENSDFKNIGGRLDRAWLEKWIAQPEGFCPSVATGNAADVAAHLATLRDAGAAEVKIPTDAASATAGAELVEKLHLTTWVEPLTKRRQHTDAGLVALLASPAAHHAHTTFPDVRLTREEATKIAAYIRSKQPAPASAALRGDAAKGQVIVAASCIACHSGATPAAAANTATAASASASAAPAASSTPGAPTIPVLEAIVRADWAVRGCVADTRGKAPDLRLTAEQKALLLAFRNADRDVGIASLRRFSAWEYAGTQMKALNCVACHSGTAGEKIPDISLAGEKFEREWVEALIAGKHPAKTRAWLETRMPAFASRASQLALGLAARQGAPLATPVKAPESTPEKIALGAKIAGTEGYSCIACHDAGSRKALGVFEGQGPNLRDAGSRLRYDYYQRWMHWPQRIAPTTIMPRYTKDRTHAVSDAHGGDDAERQFENVWQWIQALKVTGQ